MRKTTPVADYMSRLPYEVDRGETLATAVDGMLRHEIRHLPVMDGPHIFGVLSQRNVLQAWQQDGNDAARRAVGDVCARDPLVVSPRVPIPDAARQMLARGVTSALVVDDESLVGVFTSVDALRVLAAL